MAGGKFLAPETRQKLIGRLPGELHGSGQIAVERMRNLIGVVAETADLREQRRIHRAIFAGRHLDLALADKPLAQPRDRHPRLARVDASPQVLILRQPDGHGPVARCAGMGTSSGHLIRLIRLGFGSREPRPDRRGPGECGCTLLRREGFENDCNVSCAIVFKSTSRYSTSNAKCFVPNAPTSGFNLTPDFQSMRA